MESFSALDLALAKARRTKKIVIYEEHGNNYDIPTTYDDFYFYKFTTIEKFCEDLYNHCKKEYGNGKMEYEFPNYLTNDDFLIILEGYRNYNVTNFPVDIDVSKYEEEITKYFSEREQNKLL